MAKYSGSNDDKLHHLSWHGQTLILHPEKAVYWKEQDALLIADLHLGKINHFVKHGIPLPNADDSLTLSRLQDLLLEFSPTSIYILGDLFHSQWNEAWNAFEVFIKSFSEVDFYLIQGNHDIMELKYYDQAGLPILKEPYLLAPFNLMHIGLEEESELPVICGHMHPGVFLRGKGRQRLKMPCFWLKDNQLILPAFGDFTGLSPIKVLKGQGVYVVADDCIVAYSRIE